MAITAKSMHGSLREIVIFNLLRNGIHITLRGKGIGQEVREWERSKYIIYNQQIQQRKESRS